MDIIDPQLTAIRNIESNLVVNAGAGTGKTKVLTERFLYILENGELEEFKEVESIVAITFTNKASQEMIQRIREQIKENFSKGEKWKRFYRDLEKSNISTIHGFCSKILRENPIEANIDPYFEVLDENTSSKLLNQSVLQILLTKIKDDDEVVKMLRLFNKNRLEDLVEDIVSIYKSIRTVGTSFQEVKGKTVDYIKSLEMDKRNILEIKEILLYLMDNLSKNSKIYKLKTDSVWIKFYEDKYEEEELYGLIEYIKENLGKSGKEIDKQERLRELLSMVLLTKEKKSIWLYESFLNILIAVDEVYIYLKREAGGLDYDDLQNLLLDLLDNPEIIEKYQEKFRYFMIDEFQDTNELQKKIFYKLTSKYKVLDRENLFIVGDPKQSIYGFRGADIDVFYDVMEDVRSYNPNNIITLKKNYRSINTILEFVNSIFSKLMKEKYDELLAYKKSENNVDVEIIDESLLKLENGVEANDLSNKTEAESIAIRIGELVEKGKYDYGDFALLFRSTSRNHLYEKALKDYNIPYYNSSSKRYFYKQEVIDIINALKAISNPYDDISMIGFLRSPMVGLNDNSIYWLLKNKDRNLYKTMKNIESSKILIEDERSKLRDTLDLMEYFLSLKGIYDISNMVDELIEKTLFIETSLLKDDGEQSIANIYKFMDMTRKYDGENRSSLEEFIDYIEDIRKDAEEEAILRSEEANVVKLMTIHGSKGLQFPVVIIPEMSKNIRGNYPSILFNKDKGIAIRTEEARALYDTFKEDQELKDVDESKRVLYVAMTRAKELLILGNEGRNSGFKGLINGIIDPHQYRILNNLKLDKDISQKVKFIDKNDFVNQREMENINLLRTVKINNNNFNRYNISQYLKFKECPRRFFIDYFWKIDIDMSLDDEELDDEKLSAIDKGNIIHEFCNLYRYDLNREKLMKDILESYNIAYEDVIQELNPYIKNYLSNYSEDYEEIYSEKNFHIRIGENYLAGIIDRINIKMDNIEIVDYKTNKLNNRSKLIKEYEPQLQAYAYAIENILKRRVTQANILFLETGEKISIDISKEKLERNIKEIENFTNYVNKNNRLEDYKKMEKCNDYCPYISVCNHMD